MNKSPKTLGIDLEVTGALGWTYDVYKGGMHEVEFDPMIMCFSYGWYDRTKPLNKRRGKIHHERVDITFNDIVLNGGIKARNKEMELVRKAWKLLDEADEVMAFNGDRFDDKVLIAAFMRFRLGMPSPYVTIDPFKMSKAGKFAQHSLSGLCRALGIPGKAAITHSSLWRDFIAGDKKAKKLMRIYNDVDVKRMYDVFEIIFPYAKQKPKLNLSAYRNGAFCCNWCGAGVDKLKFKANRVYGTGTYRQYLCMGCGHYPRERIAEPESERAALV